MIDEKALIEELHTWQQQELRYLPCHFEALVNQQPKVGQWIPYNKEKPMTAGKYLICGHDLKDNNRLVVTTATWVHSMYSFYGNISVLAWMPLPEPYTPEGSE